MGGGDKELECGLAEMHREIAVTVAEPGKCHSKEIVYIIHEIRFNTALQPRVMASRVIWQSILAFFSLFRDHQIPNWSQSGSEK